MNKYIIFGAGKRGKELLQHIDREQISFFCDNNVNVIGNKIDGIEIISFEKLKKIAKDYKIIISVEEKSFIRRQLEKAGLTDYISYVSDERKKGNYIEDNNSEQKKIIDRLSYYVSKSDENNPIDNVLGFAELVKECKKDSIFNGWFDYPGRKGESLTYGHFKTLTEYAGLNNVNVSVFPRISHGVFFFEPYFDNNVATLYASPYYKKQMNKRFPYVPTFCVGPYINYLEQSGYTNSKDNALVIMDHSIESENIEYEYEYLKRNIFSKLELRYKKIYMCVYWYDLDKEVYRRLHDDGVCIVSSGFRFDDRFINRLKEIFDMCDNVYVYGRTSALVYALSLNKQLHYYNSIARKIEYNNLYDRCYYDTSDEELINEAWEKILLYNQGKRFSEYDEEDRNKLLKLFGITIKRPPEFFKCVYEVCGDIWKNCNFNESQYPIGVYKTYTEYQKKYDFDKLAVLSEGLGNGFWNN